MRNPIAAGAIRRRLAGALAALGIAFFNPQAPAATLTWNGGGTDDNWSTAANWNGTAMNATGDFIQFSGTNRLTPVNNFATSVIGISFLSSAGAYVLSGNAVTLAGDVTNSSTTTLETINLGLNLSSTRTFNAAAGGLLIGGVIGQTASGQSLVKTGAGTMTLTGANTYTGATTIQQGTLALSGSNGALGDGTGITVTNGATLRIDNSAAANNANRIVNNDPIIFQGGSFIFANTGGAADFSETVGVLTLSSGLNSIVTGQADLGQASTLTFSSITRTGGVIDFSGTGLGDDTRNRIIMTAPTNNDGIIGGYATVGNDFAKYDTSTGSVRAMQAADYVTTDQNTWINSSNVKATTSPSPLTTDRQINSLNLAGTNVTEINLATQTLRVESGGLLVSGSGTNSITQGVITAGEGDNTAGELILIQNGSGLFTLGAKLTNNGSGAVAFTKTGTGTVLFTESNNYTGATSIYMGSVKTTASNALGVGSAVTVGDSTTAANVDMSFTSQTIGSLTIHGNTATTDTLTVTAGETLTINGAVTIGANGIATVTNTTMTSGGNLVINAANTTVQVGGATGNNNSSSTSWDLSGLSSATINLGTTGANSVLRIGDNNTSSVSTGSSILKLAPTTTITAARLSVGGETGQVVSQILSLGTVSTIINASSIDIGGVQAGTRGIGTVNFQGSTGTLVIRGSDGTSSASMNVGASTTSTTSGAMSATVTLTGHSSDLLLSQLNLGLRSAGTGNMTSTFSFDTGTLSVGSLVMGEKLGSSLGATVVITGTLNIAGGTASISQIDMGRNTTVNGTGTATITFSGNQTSTVGAVTMATATPAGGTANATLAINGGTVTMTGAISRGGGAGTSSATVSVNGGTLDMGGFSLGDATNTVTLSAQAGILKNLGTINGASGGLTKSGTGILELQGSNAYGGPTIVSAGTLKISTLANGGAASTLGSSTNDAANLVLNGGTLQYTGAATSTDRLFSVGTSGGTLDASGTGAVNFNNTGALGFNSQTGARTLTLTGTNTGDNILAATLGDNGGASGLTKSGTGTWVLTRASTYTGATTISGGRLKLDYSATGAPGSNILSSSSTLAMNGGTLEIIGASGATNSQAFAGLSIGAGGSSIIATQNGASSLTVTFAGTSISRTAGGVLNLVGGPTSFSSATQALNSAGILGGFITLNGTDFVTKDVSNNWVAATYSALPTTGGSTTTNYTTSGNSTLSGALTINGLNITGSGGTLTTGANNITFSGTSGGLIYAGASSTDSYAIGAASGSTGIVGAGSANEFLVHVNLGTLTIRNPIIGTGAGSLTKAGSGTLILTGASSYTGATVVDAGTLEISGAGTLGSTSGVTVNTGATLRVNSTASAGAIANAAGVALNGTLEVRGNETIGALTGAGVVQNGGSTATVLTVGSTGASGTFSGVIQDGGSGTLGLSKISTGTLTLTGATANTYTGPTVVSTGTLALGKTAGVNAIAGAISVGDGVTATSATLSLSASDQIADSAVVTVQAITGGVGTFQLNGNNETIGGLASGGANASLGIVQNNSATVSSVLTLANTTDTSFSGVLKNGSTATLSLVKSGTGKQTLSGTGANTYTGSTTILAGTLDLGKTAGVNAIPGNVTVGNGSAAAVLQLAASDQIADTSIISLAGVGATAGVFRLNGNSETMGGLSSSSGGGIVENGSATVSTANLTVSVATGTVQFYDGLLRDNNGVVTGGALALTKSGAGIQVLSNDNSYTGGTTISAGVLQLGNGGTTGSAGNGAIVDNATLVINRSNSITLSQPITGSGAVFLSGAGTVTLTGNLNTYSGGTTVDQGILMVSNTTGSATGSGGVIVGNGATLAGTGVISGGTHLNAGSMLQIGNLSGDTVGQTLEFDGAFSSNGTLVFDLRGDSHGENPQTNSDLLKFGAADTDFIALGGTLKVNANGITDWQQGDTWRLIDWGSVLQVDRSVDFTLLDLPTLSGSLSFDTSQLISTGYLVVVPEPSRVLLVLGGFVALGVRRRRSYRVTTM